MNTFNPLAHVWPLTRALGGTRQDIATEGACGALMNIPFYVEFLNWKLSCGTSDSILMRNLYIVLQSVETIAMLRVLAILHVSVTIPHRWLSGKCGDFSEHDFGLYDMGLTVDLLEDAFSQIENDGKLILNEEFMMNIFCPIMDKIPPFQEYLQHMFEEKRTFALGSRKDNDRWLPFDELIAELFYPSVDYIRQSNEIACELAAVVAATFLTEFRDTNKATSASLSSIGGVRSAANVSEEDRKATMMMKASTSISESVHASSTVGLVISGTIRLDNVTAEGQTRANNDFGRGIESLVTGRGKAGKLTERVLGTFHILPKELQQSLVAFGKSHAPAARRQFDSALKEQDDARRRKEEIALERKLNEAQSEFIVAIYFHEQFHSPRCWRTVEEAGENFSALESEGQRLKGVKEQILIRYLGLGWKEAHHPWSKEGKVFSSSHLLTHLISVVIPLEQKLHVPDEPPINLPRPPELQTLGTKSTLLESATIANQEKIDKFKRDAYAERECREKAGKGDRWYEMQRTIMPNVDSSLVGFKIEMLFSYTETDGSTFLNWCHGRVTKIVNEKNRTVQITWDEECLSEGDLKLSKHKLMKSKWNPRNTTNGGWREYLTK